MFNTTIFKSLDGLNLRQFLVPTPRAALGNKTKTNEKIGIEIELEKVQVKPEFRSVPYWTTTTDGSLKVNGAEFIICCYSHKTKQAIKILKDTLNKSDCSQRTSVHVHLNVDDLTPTQLILFAYYYMIFEIPLIRFSGGRFNNFFCVPLHEWWDGNPGILTRWNKYSAINVLPRLHRDDRGHLATIEWRQMRGNLNEDYIQNWVDLIIKVKQFVVKTDMEHFLNLVLEANKTSSYSPLLKEIFKDKADLLYYPEIDKEIELTISRLKFKLYKLGIFKPLIPANDLGLPNWDTYPETTGRISRVFTQALTLKVRSAEEIKKLQEEERQDFVEPTRETDPFAWNDVFIPTPLQRAARNEVRVDPTAMDQIIQAQITARNQNTLAGRAPNGAPIVRERGVRVRNAQPFDFDLELDANTNTIRPRQPFTTNTITTATGTTITTGTN